MAINLSVQYNGGLLPGVILLTQQCYYHRGTHLNAMKSFFCINLQSMIPPKRFDIFPPDWGMLRRSRCVQIFLETSLSRQCLERRRVLIFLLTPDCVFKEKSERA